MKHNFLSKTLTIAQISDSHLFASPDGLHHQANVYQNLKHVLYALKQQVIDLIIFTGDLTQDHSEASYQLFVTAFEECKITTPVYYVAGNHDEPELLKRYLSKAPFCQGSLIENDNWQVILMASKSATPAGEVSTEEFKIAGEVIKPSKKQLIFMHHHGVDAGFFIDQHGLTNKAALQLFLNEKKSISAVACGHIHQALMLDFCLQTRKVNLYTCPATSIQFDIHSPVVKASGQPPGYRIFTLTEHQELTSEVFFVEKS